MLKNTIKNDDQLCVIDPGVYITTTDEQPHRVVIKEKTLGTVIAKQNDKFFVVMTADRVFILVHEDCAKKI